MMLNCRTVQGGGGGLRHFDVMMSQDLPQGFEEGGVIGKGDGEGVLRMLSVKKVRVCHLEGLINLHPASSMM